MQIHVIAIGKVKEPFLREGIAEYLKRLSGFCSLRITEFGEERIKENASNSEISAACQQEGKNLLKSGETTEMLIALDPCGNPMTSEAFSELLKKWEIEGPHLVTFLIGGPHGLSGEVRARADLLLSLSFMTFPHQMVRLILLEQIYRAYTINKGLPYHR